MKNSVILSLLLLSSLGAAVCSCASTRSNKAESEIICGGYTDYRELTEDEFTMFNEVCGEGEMVLTPLSVATQVVAGTNYRFWCRYEAKGSSGHCTVTIFKPLPGRGVPVLSGMEIKENEL